MQLQLLTLVSFVLGAIAVPTGGFLPTIGPFSLKVSSDNPSMQNKYLTPTVRTGTNETIVAISELPDRSWFWVPNSANPVPPGHQLAQGTLLYEVRFHTTTYNLTLDLASVTFKNPENLYIPVILRGEFDVGTAYAHAAAYSNSGAIFLNDTSGFLGCRSDVSTDTTYTLKWQTNFEPGHIGQVGYKCSEIMVSMAN
ncbi:hypothetical protein AA313_de0206554 [Arthrobotrys entomopaga]|nr:hypothetical protein AA313_de0206554 [Arthrobotrys entomopaga]